MAKAKQARPAAAAGKPIKSKAVTEAKSSPPQPPPSWPIFKPSLPVVELVPETLAESKIVVLRNFFPQNLCRNYVSFLKTLPLTTTPGKPKKGDAVRVNDRFQVEDPGFAARLWETTGLRDALLGNNSEVVDRWGGEVVGLSPNIRVYRYTLGQFFDCHYDDSNTLTLPASSGGGVEQTTAQTMISAKTTWTLLLYLTSSTDGCAGGETVFYPNDRKLAREAIAVSPETGMLLLHKHGNDCMLHEGKEVTAGEKWLLRTDLCVRR